MIIYGHNDYRDYLAHHGILGQEWGKRNGPPYPLGYGDHSASEKKAGWKKSLDKNRYGSVVSRFKEAKEARKRLSNVELNRKYSAIDPKTGLYLKSRKFSADEDMEAVNPGYKNFKKGTKINCVFCTTAYELRRRGYDVVARDSTRGYSIFHVGRWFPNATCAEVQRISDDTVKLARSGKNEELKRRAKGFFKQLPNGFRGNLMIYFDAHSGHSVVCEKQNNRIVIRDCQSNVKMTGKQFIKDVAQYCAGADCIRLDNADFDPDKIKEAVR